MLNHPLEALSEEYLLSKNIAERTVKTYRLTFKHYIKYLKDNNITYAKTSDVIKYRENKRRLGHSSYYIYINISALKGLYRYLRINYKSLGLSDHYAYDIMTPIKNERIKASIKKPILTTEQAKLLINYTLESRKDIWDYRNHAIVYLMLTSGLRRFEITHAKRGDLKLLNGIQILYIKRRGRKYNDEFVKLSKGALNAVTDYLNMRNDNNPYLFISHTMVTKEGHLSRTFFRKMFNDLLKGCGLDGLGITPHSLRHTAATMNLLRGGSVEQTRQLMRHVNIESTLIYVEHIERLKDDSSEQIEKFIFSDD